MQYTSAQLLEKYRQLPKAVQDAFAGEATADKMYNIGQENGLSIEQIGVMATETGYVLLGILHPNEFMGALAKELEIGAEKARNITEKINEQIFKPIREDLQKLHNTKAKTENAASPTAREEKDASPTEEERNMPAEKTPPAETAAQPEMPIIIPKKPAPAEIKTAPIETEKAIKPPPPAPTQSENTTSEVPLQKKNEAPPSPIKPIKFIRLGNESPLQKEKTREEEMPGAKTKERAPEGVPILGAQFTRAQSPEIDRKEEDKKRAPAAFPQTMDWQKQDEKEEKTKPDHTARKEGEKQPERPDTHHKEDPYRETISD